MFFGWLCCLWVDFGLVSWLDSWIWVGFVACEINYGWVWLVVKGFWVRFCACDSTRTELTTPQSQRKIATERKKTTQSDLTRNITNPESPHNAQSQPKINSQATPPCRNVRGIWAAFVVRRWHGLPVCKTYSIARSVCAPFWSRTFKQWNINAQETKKKSSCTFVASPTKTKNELGRTKTRTQPELNVSVLSTVP